jgi:hypothetical protein
MRERWLLCFKHYLNLTNKNLLMNILELHDKSGSLYSIPADKIFKIAPNDEGEGTIIHVDTGSKQIFYIASEPYNIIISKFQSIPTEKLNASK